MIFPGFPGVLSFFQVFQVEWEPWGVELWKKTILVIWNIYAQSIPEQLFAFKE